MPVTGVPYLIGLSLGIFVVNMAITALVALAHDDPQGANLFFVMACFTAFTAMLLVLSFRGHRSRYSIRNATVLILILVVLLPIPSAAPFYLLGISENRLDALFEGVSAFTTTGFMILSPASELNDTLLYWRASLQWIGGYFTMIAMVAILSNITLGSLPVARPNLELVDQSSLIERIEKTAIRLIPIYGALTVACFLTISFSGVDVFTALCLSLATVSTGGAAPLDGSLSVLAGPLLLVVMIVFMLGGAVNVATHIDLSRGRLRAFASDGEFLYILVAVIVFASMHFVAGTLMEGRTQGATESIFNAASLVTTTGFGAGENPFDAIPLPIVLLAVFLGGAALSTAGGLKAIRTLLLFRHAMSDMRGLTHPRRVKNLKFNNLSIDQRSLSYVWLYFFLLIVVIGLLSVVLSSSGIKFERAFSLAVLSVSNCGALALHIWPADAITQSLSAPAKVAMIAGMIIGRLEVILVMLPFQKGFWRA